MKTAPLPSFNFADFTAAPVREWLRTLHRAPSEEILVSREKAPALKTWLEG